MVRSVRATATNTRPSTTPRILRSSFSHRPPVEPTTSGARDATVPEPLAADPLAMVAGQPAAGGALATGTPPPRASAAGTRGPRPATARANPPAGGPPPRPPPGRGARGGAARRGP